MGLIYLVYMMFAHFRSVNRVRYALGLRDSYISETVIYFLFNLQPILYLHTGTVIFICELRRCVHSAALDDKLTLPCLIAVLQKQFRSDDKSHRN